MDKRKRNKILVIGALLLAYLYIFIVYEISDYNPYVVAVEKEISEQDKEVTRVEKAKIKKTLDIKYREDKKVRKILKNYCDSAVAKKAVSLKEEDQSFVIKEIMKTYEQFSEKEKEVMKEYYIRYRDAMKEEVAELFFR